MTSDRLLIATLWLGTAAACLAAPPKLTVLTMDYVGLPNHVTESAVRLARRVFNRTGIDAVWIVCHEPGECEESLPATGHYVEMLVMPSMRTRFAGIAEGGNPAGVALTGFSAIGQPRAWAFYQTVERLAYKMERPVEQVLGCVLVHEVAHVLGLHHQNTGIMRAMLSAREIDAAEMGLVFDGSEVKQLRAGVNRLSEAESVAVAR